LSLFSVVNIFNPLVFTTTIISQNPFDTQFIKGVCLQSETSLNSEVRKFINQWNIIYKTKLFQVFEDIA